MRLVIAMGFGLVVRPALFAEHTPVPAPGPRAAPKAVASIAGRYIVNNDPTSLIFIFDLSAGDFRVVSPRRWFGVGMLERGQFRGVFRYPETTPEMGMAGANGTLRAVLMRDGSLKARGQVVEGPVGGFEDLWTPAPGPMPSPDEISWWFESPGDPPRGPQGKDPPFGDDVYVEELPEAIEKPQPEYPEAARRAGVEGTVLVQALVGTDGRVKDTKVVKSVPGLDDAAVAAARKWVFKPALSHGEPVEVWVAVPVRFPPK